MTVSLGSFLVVIDCEAGELLDEGLVVTTTITSTSPIRTGTQREGEGRGSVKGCNVFREGRHDCGFGYWTVMSSCAGAG